ATVTATLLEQLRALAQAASVSATVTDSDTETGADTATATDTATVTTPPTATATDTATVPPPGDIGVPQGSKQSTATETDTLPIRPRRRTPELTPDNAAAAPRRLGRPSGPLRQRILTLLQAHPEGLNAAEIRVYLQADTPIGDVLQGMRKAGVVTTQGQRPD